MQRYMLITIAIIMVSLYACQQTHISSKNIKLTFAAFKILSHYPSGSTLSYNNNKIYLMGDDATRLLVLDTSFNVIDSVPLFSTMQKRIKKAEKVDIESSEWLNGQLCLLGSGSVSPQRENAFLIDPKTYTSETINLSMLYRAIRKYGVKEINIEAAAIVKEQLVLANRSNLTHRQNHLITSSLSAWTQSSTAKTIALNLQDSVGISGMDYLPEEDILIFTASQENTTSAYSDGTIEDSYLGVIFDVSHKLSESELVPDKWIDLARIHNSLAKQKIESVCAAPQPNGDCTLFLVADNDTGSSTLFKLGLTLK